MARITLDRSNPPEPGPIRPFNLPPVEGDSLGNGLRVRSMFRGEIPLVSVSLTLDAGETTVPDHLAGLAVLTGDSLSGGTGSREAGDLARALEGLGISLRASTGWDATSVSLTCLADRLDPALELLSEVVMDPAFPQDEVERVRQQRLAAIRQRRMDPSHQAEDALDRIVFPAGHPFHRPLSGEPETVIGLDRDAAVEFAGRRYRPDRAGLVVVGDLTGADVLDRAQRAFGAWDGRVSGEQEMPEVSLATERPIVVVDRPGAEQSELRIGLPGPSRGESDEPALEVGNALFGGAFTSRLNLRLREEKGFTYGVRSRFAMRRRGGSFAIGTSVQREVTAQALAEAMSEFERFVSAGPSDDEVVRARDYLAGIFPLRMESAAQLAARLAEVHIFGLADDYHHRYRDRIRAVSTEAVATAIARHLDPARARIVVVGDAAAIGDELAALGLGSVEPSSP